MFLVTYSLAKRKDALKLTRALYGYNDISHRKYVYKRQGILSKHSYRKLARTVLVVQQNVLVDLLHFFSSNNITNKIYEIDSLKEIERFK